MYSGVMYSNESEYTVWLSLSHMLLTKRSQTQKGFVVLSYLYRMGEKSDKSKWWSTLVGSDLKAAQEGLWRQVLYFLLSSGLIVFTL